MSKSEKKKKKKEKSEDEDETTGEHEQWEDEEHHGQHEKWEDEEHHGQHEKWEDEEHHGEWTKEEWEAWEAQQHEAGADAEVAEVEAFDDGASEKKSKKQKKKNKDIDDDYGQAEAFDDDGHGEVEAFDDGVAEKKSKKQKKNKDIDDDYGQAEAFDDDGHGEVEAFDDGVAEKKSKKEKKHKASADDYGGDEEDLDTGAVAPGASKRATHAMIEEMEKEIKKLKKSLRPDEEQDLSSLAWDEKQHDEAHEDEEGVVEDRRAEKREKKRKKREKEKKRAREKREMEEEEWGDDYAAHEGGEKERTGAKSEHDGDSDSRIISSVSSDNSEARAERDAHFQAGKLMRRNIRAHMMEINNQIPDDDYSSASDHSSHSDIDRLFAKLTGKRVLPKSSKRKKKKEKKRPEDDSEKEEAEQAKAMVEKLESEPEDVREEEPEEDDAADSWIAGDADEEEDDEADADKRAARKADPGGAMQRAIRADTGDITRIRVTIIKARGVITDARKDHSAVYCAVQLKGKEDAFTTPTVLSTAKPKWDYTQRLHNYSESDTIVFRLWDATRFGDEFLGRGKLRSQDLIEGFDGEITLKGTEEQGVRATLQVKVELLEGDEDTVELDEEEPQAPWEMPEDKLRASVLQGDEEEGEEPNAKTMYRTASGFLTGGVPKIRIQILSATVVPGALQVSNSALYCTCTNRNKSGAWFQTHVCYETEQPVWNYEQSLAQYDREDVFQFKLFEKDESGETLVGKAKLGPEQMLPDGFDGELELGGHPVLLRVKVEHLLDLEQEAEEEVVPESGLWHAGEVAKNWEKELEDEQKELQGRRDQDAELDEWKGFSAVGALAEDPAARCKLTIISGSIEMQGDEMGDQFLRVAGGVKDRPETDFMTDDVSGTLNPVWHHDIILSDIDGSDTLRLNFMEGGEVVGRKKIKFAKLTSPEFKGDVELTSLTWGVRIILKLGVQWVASDEVAQVHTEHAQTYTAPACKLRVFSALIEQDGDQLACQSLCISGTVGKSKEEFTTSIASETFNPVWDHEVELYEADEGDTVRLNLWEGDEVVAKSKTKLADLTSSDFDGHLKLTSLVEGVHVVLTVSIQWVTPAKTPAKALDKKLASSKAHDVRSDTHETAKAPAQPSLKVIVHSAEGLKKVTEDTPKEVEDSQDSQGVKREEKKKKNRGWFGGKKEKEADAPEEQGVQGRDPDAFVQCMVEGREETLISVNNAVKNTRAPVWMKVPTEFTFSDTDNLVFFVKDGASGADREDARYNLGSAKLAGEDIPQQGFKGSLTLTDDGQSEHARLELEVEWLVLPLAMRGLATANAVVPDTKKVDVHLTVVGAVIEDGHSLTLLDLHVDVYLDKSARATTRTDGIDSTARPLWHHEHDIRAVEKTSVLVVVLCAGAKGIGKATLPVVVPPHFDGKLELECSKPDVKATVTLYVELSGHYGDDDQAQAKSHNMEVLIVRANDLKNLDQGKKGLFRKKSKDASDPFVTCALKGKEDATEVKSWVVNNELNPEFNFKALMEHVTQEDTLIVAVYDEDEGSADLVGSAMLPALPIFRGGGFDGRMPLYGADKVEAGSVDMKVKILAASASDQATSISGTAAGLPDWFVKAPVRLTIVGAQKLYDTDGGKKANHSDPYCMCEIRGKKKTRFQTSVKKDSLHPVWNHTVELEEFGRNDTLDFKVCDEAWGRDEIIGEGDLSAAKVFPKGFDGDVPLKRKKKDEGATLQVVVEVLEDMEPTHAVKVICAQGVIDLDGLGSGKSDPYCVVEIEGKPAKYQTRVIKDELNPVWSHTFLTSFYAPGDTFKFSVWDKDPKNDQALGVTYLTSEELQPNGAFDGALTLRSETGADKSMGKLRVQIRDLIADANKKQVAFRSMEVKIVGAKSIRNAKYGKERQGPQPYCTCELKGNKESHFRTPSHENNLNPKWNYSSVLPLCVTTDRMLFNIWDAGDESGSTEVCLGTAELELAPYVEKGFKGDLELTGSGMRFPPLLQIELIPLQLPPMRVRVMGAYGLHGEDRKGFRLPDGFCACTIKGNSNPEFKTKTVSNSNSPSWKHEADIPQWIAEDELVFTVWDKDLKGQTFLGSASLRPIQYPRGFEGHLELSGSKEAFPPSLEIGLSFGGGETARIKRTIFVTIYGAQNLRDADGLGSGKSDPFCVCEGGHGAKFQTPVAKDTLNPEWNFRHKLDWQGAELTFTVWDQDPKKNESLGTASLASTEFAEAGFDGEIELIDPKKKKKRKAPTLQVKVDFSDGMEELSAEEQAAAEAVAKAAAEGPQPPIPVMVKILGAKALLKEKDVATSEPLVRCEIKGKPAQKFQTQGVRGMADPSWNFEKELKEYDIEDTFIFTVWDRDAPEANLIGHAMLRPKDLYPEGRFKGELKLSGSSQKRTATLQVDVEAKLKDEIPELESEEEEVVVVQQEVEEIKGLSVYIAGGNRLGYSDPALVPHKSDPYCSCELKYKPDTYNKTPVARGTLNPVWHYACRIDNYDPEDTLLFSVWDKFVQGQDFLGKAVLTKEYLWPKGFAGDITLHDDMHREAGILKVMVKILRGARQPRDMHESFVAAVGHPKTLGQPRAEPRPNSPSGSLALRKKIEQERAAAARTETQPKSPGKGAQLPGKQYPAPSRVESRIDPETKKSYRWMELRRQRQGTMSLEDLTAYWFESMRVEDDKGLPAIKVAFGHGPAQIITQAVSVHSVADDAYICKPKIAMDTTVWYTGPTDQDIVVKVFRGIPEGLMGISCKRYEYVGFIHAMQEEGGGRAVTVESQGPPYFLCLEFHWDLNKEDLGPYSPSEQQSWVQGLCDVKDLNLLEKQPDRADFLVCFVDPQSATTGLLLRRLLGHGPKSGPGGNFREPQKICTDFSIGIGRHTGTNVELRIGPCRFGRSLASDDDAWFREYGWAAKQTTHGVLVIEPSKKYVTSDTMKVVLRHIPEERKFVYDSRLDCIIGMAGYFHRITGSGPAIIRAAASGDMAAIQVFLTTDPSAPNALLAADGAGNTPLHQAALFGHHDLCALLLDARASANVTDRLGFTPLYQAAVHGQHEVVDLLLAARGNVDLPNVMGQPMLDVAAQRGYRSVVLRLRDAGAPEYYKEEPSLLSWKDRVNDQLRSAPTRW